MKINELTKLMGKTREEVEYILKTEDVIELDLTDYNNKEMRQRWLFYDS